MEQSTRMRLYRDYMMHPLRKEYEERIKKAAKGKKSARYKRLIFVRGFFWFMIPVHGVLFAHLNVNGTHGAFMIELLFGIVNLIAAFLVPIILLEKIEDARKEGNFEEISKIKEHYRKEGLIEVEDPKMMSCGDETAWGTYLCSATKEPLGDEEYFRWCRVKGNCCHCARFWNALGITDPTLYDIEKY